MNFLNLLFLIAATHPLTGRSMFTERDDVLCLLLTNGSIFSLRVVKGLLEKLVAI